MGWLQDLLYPDNEKRKNRVIQLYTDCDTLSSQLRQQKIELDDVFQRVQQAFANAAPNQTSPFANQQTFNIGQNWNVQLPTIVGPLMMLANASLTGAALAASTPAGSIMTLGFLSLFGLPRDFPRRTSSFIDISEAYGVVPAAIDGAVIRSQLRDMNQSLRDARLKLKRSQLTNQALADAMKGLAGFITSIASAMGKTKADETEKAETVVDAINDYVFDMQKRVADVTENTTRIVLSDLDTKRESWCNEDHGG